MDLAKTKDEWADRVGSFLKRELLKRDVTYVELARRLKAFGFTETEASIGNKLKRGSFPATFMLACIAALGLKGVTLDDFNVD
jgi:Domain of unknown function (DUF6471)